jgi:putative ABC transport system substrate-binding protein
MRRREFIALLGGAAAWPLAARAQQPGRTYRLGFFLPVARDAPAAIAFFDELRVHGFVEGQNLAIIPGGFQAGNERIDDLVPMLVKAAPDVIIAGGDVIPRPPERDSDNSDCGHYRGHGCGWVCGLPCAPRRQHHRNQPDVDRA